MASSKDNDRPQHPKRYLETETLPPLSGCQSEAIPIQVPALTILCHPDPERIGDQARLTRLVVVASIDVSRGEPLFQRTGRDESLPLADPYVSRRRSITLSRLDNGTLRISGELERMQLVVDGEPIAEPIIIPEESLERGVVLELVKRLVLLLHMLGPPVDGRRPDLGIIGESPAMETIRSELLEVAQTDVPVLLSGESGTGKELVASAIHRNSLRREQPYHAINMAAIPPSMAASELFGHARGAFTGATSHAAGYFEKAHRGTLFLDEVGDTPLDLQVMLLRVLETGEIQPVGARQIGHVDVRLIAATELDLEAAVADGHLRLSFIQRLSGFHLPIPPLRERRDDIARLLVHFLHEELDKFGSTNRLSPPSSQKVRPWLSASLVSKLIRYHWPGNVRQLRNVARRLVLISRTSTTISSDVNLERLLSVVSVSATPPPAELPKQPAEASPARVSEFTEEELKAALEACDYQPAAAARALGIGRTTMYKLLAQATTIRMATDIPDDELRRCRETHDGDVTAMARELEVSPRALKRRLSKL